MSIQNFPYKNDAANDNHSSESCIIDIGTISSVADIAHYLCNLVEHFKIRLHLTRKSPHLLAKHLAAFEDLANYLDDDTHTLKTLSLCDELPDVDAVAISYLADTAHDLRNLVSNFKIRLYLIQKSPHLLTEHLTSVEHLVNYLDGLVRNVMRVSRLELGGRMQELKLLDLNIVVARVIQNYEPIAQHKHIRLTSEFAAHLSPILADNLDIERVVANVLGNALNYTPQAGTINVTTAQETDEVLLMVRDSGIGISSYALPYIFERSFRSEDAQSTASGTGLGLAIVQGIVQKYGGHIEVESIVGEGSAFKIFLPF